MDARPNDTAWYLAQLKRNGERIAEENLLRQGFETFLPKSARTTRSRSRFRQEFQALFPGYLFVRADSRQPQWRAVGNTLGVQRLVTFGDDGPSKVSNDLIALLKSRCDDSGVIQLPAVQRGDQVRIKSGPFAAFLAHVQSVPSERRVWLLLDFMGQRQRVSVRLSDVELSSC